MNYIGLDLSTKTGFVKLSPAGEVLFHREICHPCDSPQSFNAMAVEILNGIEKDFTVVIEDFGFGSQRGFQLGGIGWLVRWALWRKGIQYHLVSPNGLKKFASGKGNVDKRALAVAVNDRWGYFNNSDNITDAFVLAHIARSLKEPVQLTSFQQEVIDVVLNKNPKPKKPRRKKQ